jgi:hypothetical protein
MKVLSYFDLPTLTYLHSHTLCNCFISRKASSHHVSFFELNAEFFLIASLILVIKRTRDRVEEAKFVSKRAASRSCIEHRSLHELRAIRKVILKDIPFEDAICITHHAVIKRVTRLERKIFKSLLSFASHREKVEKNCLHHR